MKYYRTILTSTLNYDLNPNLIDNNSIKLVELTLHQTIKHLETIVEKQKKVLNDIKQYFDTDEVESAIELEEYLQQYKTME